MSRSIRKRTAAFVSVVCAFAPIASGQTAVDAQGGRVTFTIDAEKNVKPISPFIYGINRKLEGNLAHLTLRREGGNRWTAYNWLNNASNAGSDWQFQNDGIMRGGDEPGGALLDSIQNTSTNNAALIVTIPIIGHVAADKKGDGDVHRSGPDYLQTRFREERPAKGAPFDLHPDPNGKIVYQDEFVNWLKTRCPYLTTDPKRQIFFSLDNEPDLWASTHAEVHPQKVTYAEVVQNGIDYAKAIKNVVPKAKVIGPVNYGWHGFGNLQDAPDANHRDFQEFYLDQMAAAEKQAGHRLLDVFDVHWYPEAQGGKVRITEQNATPAVAAARVQAPRSLWDPTYTEDSWIAKWDTKGPITLIPRLMHKISTHYPGTTLSMTEYYYGGASDISGGIAQADVLGIGGQYGLFAACEWPMTDKQPFIDAGFEMFRNFDGTGGAFGDTSIGALTTDVSSTSIYASLHPDHKEWMTLVAINKTDHDLPADVALQHATKFTIAKVYQLTSQSAGPIAGQAIHIAAGRFACTLPPMSVTTLRLTSAP
jgi:hypothetical protein